MGPTEHLKFCTERGRLLDFVNEATGEYARAANDLAARMGTLLETEYRRIRAEVEKARLHAEHAREAFLQHRREHGC